MVDYLFSLVRYNLVMVDFLAIGSTHVTVRRLDLMYQSYTFAMVSCS
jgi:hypothetical protein